MANRIVHFEIGAQDPERCAKFYADTFGWEIKKWDPPSHKATDGQGSGETPYWMVMTGKDEMSDKYPGIDGGIFKREKSAPGGEANAYICTVSVDDIDKTMDKVTANGGKVNEKNPIPGVGDYAQAWDTEGNRFSILQPAPMGASN